ncbi:hypothetical protein ACCO45_001705 [Purpureocillium lilacinum]|uniref:Uncharacterized protein n=1 Tax=Purpureocillium lilacinum TaxID=33203 RepID=A0ACC4E8B1_PURLI
MFDSGESSSAMIGTVVDTGIVTVPGGAITPNGPRHTTPGAGAGDILPELDALLSATPTPTTPPSAASDADNNHYQLLRARQSAPTATVTVVSGSGDSSDSGGSSATTLSGGAIAGIVIGSIAGFLLLVWIYRSCFNIGAPPGEDREAWYHDVDPKRSPHRHHHHHSYTHSRPRHGGGHHHRHHSRRRSSLSSTMSTPPPVVVRETSRTQPVYVSRGRDRVSRSRGGSTETRNLIIERGASGGSLLCA